MARHRHILVPHCNGRQACKWVCCVVCNEYGDDPPGSGRWTRNPYEFLPEPKPDATPPILPLPPEGPST